MHDVERRLVQIAARIHLGTAQEGAIHEFSRQSINGLVLAETAAREGVAGIVASELQRVYPRTPIDGTPLNQLSRIVQPLFVQAGAHFSELPKLGDALDDEGLRVIVLKGGALLATVYHRQLALRPLSDIDLLVNHAQRAAVEEVFRARGFVATVSAPNLFSRGQLVFDLHSDVASSERIRRRSLAFRLSSRRLEQRALPLGCGSRGLFVLSDVHQFLHASIHALKHSYSRLIWVVDLAHLIRRVDWHEMLAEAKASGTTRAVAYTCHVLQRALDVELPPGWTKSLPSLNTLERSFVAGVSRRSEGATSGELLVIFSIRSPWERLAYLFELAFPRRAVLARLFPRTPRSLLLPRRCAQMVVRALFKVVAILNRPGTQLHAWSRRTLETLTAE